MVTRGGVIVLLAVLGVGAPRAVAGQGGAASEQVAQQWQLFLRGVEAADFEAVMSAFADVPEFRYVDSEGGMHDYAATREMLSQAFQGYNSAKHMALRRQIQILGSDAVLYVFNGTADCVLNDGSVMRYGSLTFAAVFRKYAEGWKIVYLQESFAPPEAAAS